MNTKQQIIDEYLRGGYSFRQFAKISNISSSTLHRWIMDFQGRSVKVPRDYKMVTLPLMKNPKSKEDLSVEMEALKKELAQERLRNKLLTAMIDIAEEQLKIPIRKKSGAKRSKK